MMNLRQNNAARKEDTMSTLHNEEKAKEIALLAAKALDEKKARNIKVLYVNNQTIIADYFVIAHGTSRTQVNALADEVEYRIGLCGVTPANAEMKADNWKVLDYSNVIVHIFDREARDFYKLDKLYTDFE